MMSRFITWFITCNLARHQTTRAPKVTLLRGHRLIHSPLLQAVADNLY
jgi:hypothetical protein